MEREVQVLRRDMGRPFERPRPVVRVGAYCRVSTELEAQQSSLDLQIMTFKAQIALHAGWVLADIYADDGVSGTLASRRTEFQRMIRDCRAGRIEILLPTWIQSHDSLENVPPFEYLLNPLFGNRYGHRKRSERLVHVSSSELFSFFRYALISVPQGSKNRRSSLA